MIRMGTSSAWGRRWGEYGVRWDVRNGRTGPGTCCAYGETSATGPDKRAPAMEPGHVRCACGRARRCGVMSRRESRKCESKQRIGFFTETARQSHMMYIAIRSVGSVSSSREHRGRPVIQLRLPFAVREVPEGVADRTVCRRHHGSCDIVPTTSPSVVQFLFDPRLAKVEGRYCTFATETFGRTGNKVVFRRTYQRPSGIMELPYR